MIAHKELLITVGTLLGIILHLVIAYGGILGFIPTDLPLYLILGIGGGILVWELLTEAIKGEIGADFLAGISIVTSVLLGEYLAGSLVVLMLSGGEALESYAVSRASGALDALARRMPQVAHKRENGKLVEVAIHDIKIGDMVVVLPHEICPVDGTVREGHGVMDEAYLTGEPYQISKAPGSDVISGAINGEHALVVEATREAKDSRYAKIISVVRECEQNRPRIRRLADLLGGLYTPIAVLVALGAWIFSGDPVRFLSVLVIATPCPLLIAIPTAIIGSVSLAAKRGIIIRNPEVLEIVRECKTLILDKTGTLTYGKPVIDEAFYGDGLTADQVLPIVASLEQYSKHPLAKAVVNAAAAHRYELFGATEVSEKPGQGLTGTVHGQKIEVTSRKKTEKNFALPSRGSGLECVVLIDGKFAALYRFRDGARTESGDFIKHLGPKHSIERVIIVSGDRESEVRHLADEVGIKEIYAEKSPEDKVAIVKSENVKAKTIFIGDGINDAPALLAATVGIAFGSASDVTTGAAGAVILDSNLQRVDEFFHIGARMRTIALQSAIGGMILSVFGMGFAATGYLSPIWGAVGQEIIDLLAVLNALRVVVAPSVLSDMKN